MAITYDIHTHSAYSTDSGTPVREQIEAARKKGLSGICLTDHMDYDFPEDIMETQDTPPFVFDYKAYQKELNGYRSQYSDMWIGTGVECGLQPSDTTISKVKKLTEQPGWDFVIGSIHLIDHRDPYYPVYWEGKDPASCVRTYYETMFECLSLFSDFDSLGHMDYVVRYAPEGFHYNPLDFFEITDEIMKFLIRKDIALEVNSSRLSRGTFCENPHPDLLKRYVQLGGELITIGSDAHTPEQIASSFSVLEQHIKKTGLRQYNTYHSRRPVFHDL